MKGKFRQFTMVMIATVVFFAPAFVGADVFMKEKQHTDGMTIMGHAQPPQDRIDTIWITKDKMRRDQGDTSSIAVLDNDKVTIYHLDHKSKTYFELSPGSDKQQDAASAMMGDLKVKVTPTNETKQIGTWNCKKYLQELNVGMMPTTSEVWASEDIKIPFYDLYEKLSTSMMTQQPGMATSMQAMQEEMKKIKGVPVLTTTSTTMMKDVTIKSSRELLEIKEDTAPAGIFDIPSGYTKKAMPEGMGERRMPGKQKAK